MINKEERRREIRQASSQSLFHFLPRIKRNYMMSLELNVQGNARIKKHVKWTKKNEC